MTVAATARGRDFPLSTFQLDVSVYVTEGDTLPRVYGCARLSPSSLSTRLLKPANGSTHSTQSARVKPKSGECKPLRGGGGSGESGVPDLGGEEGELVVHHPDVVMTPGALLPFALYQHPTPGYTFEQWTAANDAMLRRGCAG